jgi:hypothetical protein
MGVLADAIVVEQPMAVAEVDALGDRVHERGLRIWCPIIG